MMLLRGEIEQTRAGVVLNSFQVPIVSNICFIGIHRRV
jgi:hypothetical protein